MPYADFYFSIYTIMVIYKVDSGCEKVLFSLELDFRDTMKTSALEFDHDFNVLLCIIAYVRKIYG